jgi:hypothetical protein
MIGRIAKIEKRRVGYTVRCEPEVGDDGWQDPGMSTREPRTALTLRGARRIAVRWVFGGAEQSRLVETVTRNGSDPRVPPIGPPPPRDPTQRD